MNCNNLYFIKILGVSVNKYYVFETCTTYERNQKCLQKYDPGPTWMAMDFRAEFGDRFNVKFLC
jgi:hypothetical protein